MSAMQQTASVQEAEKTSFTDTYLYWMLGLFLKPYILHLIVIGFMLIGVTILSLIPPFLIQQAVDGPITTGDLSGLVPLAVIYTLCVPGIFGLRFAYTYLLQTVGQNALVAIRQRLFEHVLTLDMRYFNTTPVGQIVSRLTSDVEVMTELLSTSIVMVLSNGITLIGIIGAMLLLNWKLALFGLAVLVPMAFATIHFRKGIRASSARLHKIAADYLAFNNEQFSGMLIVQLFGRQKQSIDEFEALNAAHRDTHMVLRDLYTHYSSFNMGLSSAGLCLVIFGGVWGVSEGWATLGVMLAMIQYTRRSFEPILMLGEQFSQIQMALAAGERMARLLRVEPGIPEPAKPQTVDGREKSLTFDHVTFGYDDGVPVLRDIDLHIPAKQRVAIVGATGAGKTSLAGLIARFYDVNEGRVLINGVDLRDIKTEDLRKVVMVVPQTPYCFHGTIAENLTLFDASITEEAMRKAAETASAAPFIEALPGKYGFKLLPGGANLSHGQRQLLALARALLHSPDSILVLDEATSNIDTETELHIQRGLNQILTGRTSIVIAHRLSTIRDSDRILVMQRGQVVEEGTHDELLERGGLYADLYERQFADEEAVEISEAGD